MGREIKFRAKRIDDGRWVYGQYFKTPLTDENSGTMPDAGWFFLCGEPRDCIVQYGVSFVIDVKTLGQYTGIKDKNGCEIYEGDIVEEKWNNPLSGKEIVDRYKIETAENSLIKMIHSSEERRWSRLLFMRYQYIEVIGNIYENPELLEGANH